MSSIVSLRNVIFDYPLKGGYFRALRGINLEITRGEFVAIVGASGSGKTTLLNLMGLMSRPSEGNVAIDGVDATLLEDDALARLRNEKIGFVFQFFHLLPRLSILENVLLPASYRAGAGNDAATEAQALAHLTRFGILDQQDKRPSSLSGGQRQRAAICRALLLQPALVLADEPTGALDSKTSEIVLDIFEQLQQEGYTIVVITHDTKVAARAHRVIKMADGVIVSDNKEVKQLRSEDATSPALDIMVSSSCFTFWRLVAALKFSWRCVDLAMGSLAANWVRSVLAVCGLGIGMASIIIMLTLTNEVRNIFGHIFNTAGANRGFVTFDRREADRLGSPRWSGMDVVKELPKMAADFEQFGRIAPMAALHNCLVQAPGKTFPIDIQSLFSFAEVKELDLRVARGRLFTVNEMLGDAPTAVAVIGKETAAKLFPTNVQQGVYRPEYPLGEILRIQGCAYGGNLRLVGVLENRDASLDSQANDVVLIPTRLLITSGALRFESTFVVSLDSPEIMMQPLAIEQCYA